MKNKKKKIKKKVSLNVKRVLILILSIFVLGEGIGMFLLYGPYPGFRNLLITTAMTTKSHQYLARWWFSEDEINKVLANNYMIEVEEDTNEEDIDFEEEEVEDAENKYEKQVLDHEENEVYKVIYVNELGYNGYVVAVYDASKVKIGTTSKLGSTGQSLKVIAKKNKASVAVNASGFYDPDWNSNGAIPHGTVIQNGKVVYDYDDAKVGGGFVGFNKDNVLMLGRWTREQALKKGLRDAVEFGPFLIVNGKKSFVKGDGGWGIAPRTAIGQRRDGIVIMAVINGRGKNGSIGIDMVGLTALMEKFGCYNAANMDGGSSSALVVNNKVINSPCAGGEEGLRNIPTAWIVTK